MCAIEAGKRGRRVAVLERAEPRRQEDSDLRRRPLQFHQPALPAGKLSLRKSPLCEIRPGAVHASDFIALVEKHRIPYHEKTLGQLFCDRSAQDIVDMLETECRRGGSTNRF